MPYVNWKGDWCHRQPAVLTGARVIVFPLLGATDKLAAICQERINGPSGGRVQATPLSIPLVNRSLLLLACADFPHIGSDDPNDSQLGYIRERDLGFCVPVKLTVNGNDRGVHVVTPFLWVDNPAGVIEGREIFGFPKILGAIAWETNGALTFQVDSLVFDPESATTAATDDWLLKVEPGGPFAAVAPETNAVAGANDAAITQQLVGAVLGLPLLANLGLAITGFTSVALALLKQFRAVEPNPVDAVSYQEVVCARFDVKGIVAARTHVPAGRQLVVTNHPSVPIGSVLGIDRTTALTFAVDVDVDLYLTGAKFA